MGVYYNEFDPFAAQWLRNLIALGLIAPGDVDERSIKDVTHDDLRGYSQAHFFAGIGGWSLAARLAGWPDARPLWTGSCPCQPFSTAGKGGGVDDPRHLWPDFFRLIRACRPPVVMGEQVAGAAGYGWLDGVLADLAGEDYAGRGVDIPACAVDAPHIRQRLYWIAVGDAERRRCDGPWVSGGAGEGVPGASWADGREACGAESRLAHPGGCGPGGRAVEPGGDLGDGHSTGREEGAGWSPGGDEGDVADAQRVGQTPHRRDAGEVRGLQEAQREPGHYAAVSRREHGEAVDGLADPQGVAQGDACGQGLALGSVPGVERGDVRQEGPTAGPAGAGSFWSRHAWIECHDGKARRIPEPGFPLLAPGLSGRVAARDALGQAGQNLPQALQDHLINRVGAWRGFGNAIVPREAAEVIRAWMECAP